MYCYWRIGIFAGGVAKTETEMEMEREGEGEGEARPLEQLSHLWYYNSLLFRLILVGKLRLELINK